MITTLVTAPAAEPVTAAEVQEHRVIDSTLDPELVTIFITAARERCEAFTGRALITQTWDLVMDSWPGRPRFGQPPKQPLPYPVSIQIPKPPLVSVTSVTYYDTTETAAVMSSSDYYVDTDTQPGRVALQYSKIWPTTVLRPANGIRVRFVCGYGASSSYVPQMLRLGMLYAIGHWFENREEIMTGRGVTAIEVPQTTTDLWTPYRCFTEDHF